MLQNTHTAIVKDVSLELFLLVSRLLVNLKWIVSALGDQLVLYFIVITINASQFLYAILSV